MNENPYPSPQSSMAVTTSDNTPVGLWRDRNQLVMRIRDPHFPPRCIKTNENFRGSPVRVDVEWIPNHGMWLLMLGAVGHAVAKSMCGKRISVEIPVSHEWLSKRKRKANIGWAMIVGGMVCFVLGTIGYVCLMVSGMDENSSEWILFGILASPLIAIAGIIYLVVWHRPILRVRKITDEHAWIDKICRDFLESLPEWPG